MARTQRIEYEGAVYHVTARGNERREIFRDDAEREHFLRVLGESVGRFEGLFQCLTPRCLRTAAPEEEEAVQGKSVSFPPVRTSMLDRTRRFTSQVRSLGGPACPESVWKSRAQAEEDWSYARRDRQDASPPASAGGRLFQDFRPRRASLGSSARR